MNEKYSLFLKLLLFYHILLTLRCPEGENCSTAPDHFNALCSINPSSNDTNSWKDMFWTLNKQRISSDSITVEDNFTISLNLNNSDDIGYDLECFYNNLSLGALIIKGKLPKVFADDLPIIYISQSESNSIIFWKNVKGEISHYIKETSSAATLSLAYFFSVMIKSNDTRLTENGSFVESHSQYILSWDSNFSAFFSPSGFKNVHQMSLSNEIPKDWYRKKAQCPNRTLQSIQKDLQKAQHISLYSQEIFVNWNFSSCDKLLIRNSVAKICTYKEEQENCTEKFCDENCWFKNLTSSENYIVKSYHFLQLGSVLTFLSKAKTKYCDPVRNFQVTYKNASQIFLSWNNPNHLPGLVNCYYMIYRNKSQSEDEAQSCCADGTSFSITEGIEGFKTYVFTLAILIYDATELSDPVEIEVTTDISNPSDIQHSLHVYYRTDVGSLIISWSPPKIPNGPIDYYLLSYYWEENGKTYKEELQVLGTVMNLNITCNLGVVLLYKFQVKAVNINSTEIYYPSNKFVEVNLCHAMEVWPFMWIAVAITVSGILLCFIGILLYLHYQRCVNLLCPPVVMPEKIITSAYTLCDEREQTSSCMKRYPSCWIKDKGLQIIPGSQSEVKFPRGFGNNEFLLRIGNVIGKPCLCISEIGHMEVNTNCREHYSYLTPIMEIQEIKPNLSTSMIDDFVCNPFYTLTSDDKNLNISNIVCNEKYCYPIKLRERVQDESVLQNSKLSDSGINESLKMESVQTSVLLNNEEIFLPNYENLLKSGSTGNCEDIHSPSNERLSQYIQIGLQDILHNEFTAEDRDDTLNLGSERLSGSPQMILSEDLQNIADQRDTVVPQAGYCVVALNDNISENNFT